MICRECGWSQPDNINDNICPSCGGESLSVIFD